MRINILFALLIFILQKQANASHQNKWHYNKRWSDDAMLNFTELAVKYAGICEEYDIITGDGYILKLFRIPGDPFKPVMMVHGNFGSADDWMILGETSLPVALHRQGYDVWLTNYRGNRYGLRHVTLHPDHDEAFWDYSIHELGAYDAPAAIDFILGKTGQKQLSAIGYSVGTTIFYILGATRPKYNSKINIVISLAPICYMHNSKPALAANILAPVIISAAKMLNYVAINRQSSTTDVSIRTVCSNEAVAYNLCLESFAFPIFGYDSKEISYYLARVLFAHFPSSNSLKVVEHFSQIISKMRFSKFDYGPMKNLVKYGNVNAPNYNLHAVSMRVALVVGKNDLVSTIDDVALLRRQLPNVVSYKLMEPAMFNHLDFSFGKSTHFVLYPHIFQLLKRYGGSRYLEQNADITVYDKLTEYFL